MIGTYKLGLFIYKTFKIAGRTGKTTVNLALIFSNFLINIATTSTLLIWDTLGLTIKLITVSLNEVSIILKSWLF
jgi:hypothetical protein